MYQKIEGSVIEMKYILMERMIADMLMKALIKPQH